MSTVITVENLGKKYTISHQQREEYSSLRETLTNGITSLGKRLINPFGRSLTPHPSSLINTSEDFWALKDVSFEVKQGDRIGIIGRNGAGKSTLLKILSRITEPTTGSIRIKGRVASLLEVGTGFHPELTGRENIYLNGAILGMHREEIRRKFDEIVAFAEIEKFLDTPVKRYSSGMYVRLAFAVAAHLEPEILIVDEVLAVGDAQFQKKCLGKMEDVGKEGRTVLFVSHNIESIKSLCTKGILLDHGKNEKTDYIDGVVRAYESLTLDSIFVANACSQVIYSNDSIKLDSFDIIEVKLTDSCDKPIVSVKTFDSFKFKVKFNSPDFYESKSAAIFVSTFNRRVLLRLGMHPFSSFRMVCKKGLNELVCGVKKIPLPAGTYLLRFAICESQTGEWLFESDLCPFEVRSRDIYCCGLPPTENLAAVVSDYFWETV